MNIIDKLSNKLLINKEIDKYLVDLGWQAGTPISSARKSEKGFCKWIEGSLYDTHITITSKGIYMYKEYNCGAYIHDLYKNINFENMDKVQFIKSLKTIFEKHNYMFDEEVQSQF
jgi:hypothetical protein